MIPGPEKANATISPNNCPGKNDPNIPEKNALPGVILPLDPFQSNAPDKIFKDNRGNLRTKNL
jgi:hypothetical protein